MRYGVGVPTGRLLAPALVLPHCCCRPDPMALGNMRRNGVRTLAVFCGAIDCHHQAVIEVEHFADSVRRMRCTVYEHLGSGGVASAPNLKDRLKFD